MVLWVLSLMTIMAGSFSLSTQRESAMLRHAHERSRAISLAEGAIYYAMLMLNLPDIKTRWKSDGRPYFWDGKGSQVLVRIHDEGGKVDLNAADENTLKTIFRIMGLVEAQFNPLTDAILDWRDQDDLKRSDGAELADYQALGLQSLPQNRQFLVMDEVLGVKGVTPDLYRKMQAWFTLYSNAVGLDPNKASPEILLILLGGDRQALGAAIQQRLEGMPVTLPPFPGLNYTQSSDNTYSITAEVMIDEDQQFGVIATMRRGAMNGNLPFTLLRWRHYHRPSKSQDEL